MNIEIWSVGKASEPYMVPAIAHFLAKVKPYNSVELIVINALRKGTSPSREAVLNMEEESILKKLEPRHHLVLLDERGKLLTSPEWSAQFQGFMNNSIKTLVLLIGGAYGVTDAVRARASQTWSLSKLVFPHQLVRLIVAEQVYRAFSILHNSPYHHS